VIESDIFANAITIIGKDADIKTMEGVITDLDKAAMDNSIQVRVIPLKGVQAAKMAEVIRRVYGQMSDSKIVVTESKDKPTGAAPGPKGATGKPTTRPAATTQAADAEAPPIVIAVDVAANALIISATRTELENVSDLIERLSDSTTGGEAEFRKNAVESVQPTQAARIKVHGQRRQRRSAATRHPAPGYHSGGRPENVQHNRAGKTDGLRDNRPAGQTTRQGRHDLDRSSHIRPDQHRCDRSGVKSERTVQTVNQQQDIADERRIERATVLPTTAR
jgi:hypothetical protein